MMNAVIIYIGEILMLYVPTCLGLFVRACRGLLATLIFTEPEYYTQ